MAFSFGQLPVGRVSAGNTLIYGTPYTPPPEPDPTLAIVSLDPEAITVIVSGNAPSAFGVVAGYNFYIDGVKDNDELETTGTYTFADLDENTAYDLSFKFVNVADTESAAYGLITASTVHDYVDGGPISSNDRFEIDTIVGIDMAAFPPRPGIGLKITGPRGNYQRCYGQAIVGGRALALDDYFRIGSISKSFCAALIFMAIDRGDLTLDTTIDEFTITDGLPNRETITIRHLLQMRSGIGNFETAVQFNFYLNPTGPFTADQALAMTKALAPVFAPGTAWQYVNFTYVLLGMIAIELDGGTRAIGQLVTEEVLTPLGLTETIYPSGVGMPPGSPNGYGANQVYAIVISIPIIGPLLAALGIFGGPTRIENNFNPEWMGISGCMISNIDNMYKWAIYLRDGMPLMDPETLELWLETIEVIPDLEAMPLDQQSYGGGIFHIESTYGPLGTIMGFTSLSMIEPSSGAIFTMFENHQTPGAMIEHTFAGCCNYLYPGSMEDVDYEYEYVAPPTIVTYETAVSAEPIPVGATTYRVQMVGGGGGGGSGRRNNADEVARGGGGGGGGGALIDTGVRPIAELGANFTTTLGVAGLPGAGRTGNGNGNAGSAGGATTFSSGSKSLSAGAGTGGAGASASVGGGAGSGGAAAVTGLTGLAVVANGSAGSAGGTSAQPATAATNTAGGAAGGGGGGGTNSTTDFGVRPGGGGGSSAFQDGAGPAGNTGTTAPGKPGGGGGGGTALFNVAGSTAGGSAAGYGGGGGGGGARKLGTTDPGGSPGPGFLRVEFFIED